jgi:hypothetical protein
MNVENGGPADTNQFFQSTAEMPSLVQTKPKIIGLRPALSGRIW